MRVFTLTALFLCLLASPAYPRQLRAGVIEPAEAPSCPVCPEATPAEAPKIDEAACASVNSLVANQSTILKMALFLTEKNNLNVDEIQSLVNQIEVDTALLIRLSGCPTNSEASEPADSTP